ncbi:hypothetical protein JH06_0446 [Blastocystis sp. subtype 4]|uniref:hypothetical protein n=1 Tax=Blastocystis sp. subtype 4 TaxID=944170 RepID=UPI000711DC78|nr:hypothetical protein JH06_0446 [Blastocystis sp. subtype 4]KNB46020.1 hypothetical protein JH06_0446 [Blastocystis sp. subtype 4]|eukprot:XP_014529463.1 hypothetical protein JH06_0446 [Blastocystis sp. subtype 4]
MSYNSIPFSIFKYQIILECPCCHQRGFKGIHGLRTHIGGYCQKRHSKDWRQHFKEFFVQLEKRLASISNKEITAYSIIINHFRIANAVSSTYGSEENTEVSYSVVPDDYHPPDRSLKDFIGQLKGIEPNKSHRTRTEEKPTVIHANSTSSVTTRTFDNSEENTSCYNLRHKSSSQSAVYSSGTVTAPLTPAGSSPTPAPSPPVATISPAPFSSGSVSPVPLLSSLDKNNPQNAIMDCPFCEKSGYCGLSGIRTHIRNYCPAIDKSIWREKFIKCIKHNIQKYEELNRTNPEGQKEFNNQVIAYLQAKANSDGFKKSSLKYENRSLQGKDGSQLLGTMNPIPYEEIYCTHCNDENDYCPFCGCITCHYKHLASQLLICDGCNREHHTFCLSPPLKTIPEGNWFCPDCLQKQHRFPTQVCRDRNYALGECQFSSGVQSAIQSIVSYLSLPASKQRKQDLECVFHSLSIPDLIQLQTC